MYLDYPENFNFQRTVYSHGWYSLLPFELDETNWRLSYVFSSDDLEQSVTATISEENNRLKIEIPNQKVSQNIQSKVLNDFRHILRLDDDLSEFYQLAGGESEYAWIAESRAGRLLRSPTVFEDLIKTVCTTNCNWAMTKKMVTNLVEKLGEASKDGRRAFPTAEKMAEMPPDFYRDEIRAGYRSPYFTEIAEQVATGKLKPQEWLHTDLPTKELKKQMKRVKGVGDYAAENLLKLVGRYDGLALDSWLRAQFYKRRNDAVICTDKEIEKFYERFDKWKGLVLWCDMTKEWLD